MKDKITTRDELVPLREHYRAAGKTVGYTSGVFDILHPGHVQYLEDAKALVDVLIVGVNSDASVRANKGDSRPINNEESRAAVVAGLASVSHVFVFGEQNNNTNVQVLQPDVYIKAGDYSSDKLTSKSIVEQSGGRVELVPFVDGKSTTSIIEKISASLVTKEGEHIAHEKRPAIFVDRDGTINEHIEYLSEAHRLKEIPGSFVALKKMRELGYRIIVVTNQPGIGLGYFTKEDFFAVNREMLKQATAVGCSIDRIYFCPHSKGENCRCRKPSPFLLERAAQECNIDLSRSFMIGDMTSDIELAKNAGCQGVLVQTGRGGDDGLYKVTPDAVVRDLTEAATYISAFGVVTPEKKSPISRASVAIKQQEAAVENAVQEFNAVLGAVLGCASLIDQKTRDTAGRSPVESTLGMLRKIVNRGLALTNGTAGRASLKACSDAVKEVVLGAHGNGCVVEVFCPSDSLVEAPESAIVELFVELVENLLEEQSGKPERYVGMHLNAVEVADEGKKLDLAPGRYARVSFVDSDHAPALITKEENFNPFLSQRLRSTGRGVGATLAAARTLLKKVGGNVTLSSASEATTTLSLYFPLPLDAVVR
jgi:rfaE bifunctional protein nucleotidyltransferase chain/domain